MTFGSFVFKQLGEITPLLTPNFYAVLVTDAEILTEKKNASSFIGLVNFSCLFVEKYSLKNEAKKRRNLEIKQG